MWGINYPRRSIHQGLSSLDCLLPKRWFQTGVVPKQTANNPVPVECSEKIVGLQTAMGIVYRNGSNRTDWCKTEHGYKGLMRVVSIPFYGIMSEGKIKRWFKGKKTVIAIWTKEP